YLTQRPMLLMLRPILSQTISLIFATYIFICTIYLVRDISLAKAEIGVLGLVLALTTLGNSFVLWVLLRRRKYNAPMHLFMVNLCVADLVVAFFQVLPQLVWDITERFQGPDVLCRSVKYLQIVGMFASSYMIVAMTVDRHNAICCPLQAYKGGAVSRWNTPIMVAWGLALVLSVPQVFIFSRSEVSPGVFECWGKFAEPWGLKAYVTWMTIAVFLLPTFIITVCQVRIFKEIHDNIYLKSEHTLHGKSVPHRNAYNTTAEYSNASSNPSFPPYPLHPPLTGVSKAMSKTVRMTLVIVLVYTLCWSPFFTVQLWAAWDPNPPDQGVAFTILMLLASLNSCTNPWIYTAFSSSVSGELLALLRCRPKLPHRSSMHDHSSDINTSTTKDNQY
uniref:Vasopressin V2 receptor n=1 Tax=Cyprinus carpio TaxID=7962 RepID=A0A8C1GNA0_CYPCA